MGHREPVFPRISVLYVNSSIEKSLVSSVIKRTSDFSPLFSKVLSFDELTHNPRDYGENKTSLCVLAHTFVGNFLKKIKASDSTILLIATTKFRRLLEQILKRPLPIELPQSTGELFEMPLTFDFKTSSSFKEAVERTVLTQVRYHGLAYEGKMCDISYVSPGPNDNPNNSFIISAMLTQIYDVANEISKRSRQRIPAVILGSHSVATEAMLTRIIQSTSFDSVHHITPKVLNGLSSSQNKNYLQGILKSTDVMNTSLVVIENLEEVIEYDKAHSARWNQNKAYLIGQLFEKHRSDSSVMVVITASCHDVLSKVGLGLRYRLANTNYLYDIKSPTKLKRTIDNAELLRSRGIYNHIFTEVTRV